MKCCINATLVLNGLSYFGTMCFIYDLFRGKRKRIESSDIFFDVKIISFNTIHTNNSKFIILDRDNPFIIEHR